MPVLNSSLLPEYPQRGPWGDSKFWGNWDGHIMFDLIDTFEPKFVLDPMEGSGTTRAVCAEKEIPYLGYDLTTGTNLLSPMDQERIRDEVVTLTGGAGMDLIGWHPPYWAMVPYNRGDPNDLSAGTYPMFLTRMQMILRFLSTLLNSENRLSRIAILMGDMRKHGKYYWIPRDLTSGSKLRDANLDLANVLIRRQQGVSSDVNLYESPNGPLIRIMHETLLIMRPSRSA